MNGAEFPAIGGSTTTRGYVPGGVPVKKRSVFSCVEEMYATLLLREPLKEMLAPGKNPVPVMMRGVSIPLWALGGLMEIITGGGGCVAVMLKGADIPAGAGSTTLIGKVPIEGTEKPETDS